MIESPVAPSEEQIDPYSLPLWKFVSDENLMKYYTHPRRKLQISDKETADHFFDEEQPTYMSVDQLWQQLGTNRRYKNPSWHYISKFFGTDSMYSSLPHKLSIHGDGHQDRVTLYSYLLGQYKGLSEPEMKVLLVASSVHDRARTDDREAPHHGLDAAKNISRYINEYKNRGFHFTEKEITQIALLCVYHEKPWEEVPQFQDQRMNLLIQTLQAADAADRYRSPNREWWPKKQYFDGIFDSNTTARDAFLEFTKYVTLSSEKDRFNQSHTHPEYFVEDAIKNKALEVGLIKPPFSFRRILLRGIENFATTRRVGTAAIEYAMRE